MKHKTIFLYTIGALLCFLLFFTGMIYAEQKPLLILMGILGASGFSYCSLKIILLIQAKKRN